MDEVKKKNTYVDLDYVGDRLRRKIESSGCSVRDVANQVGVSKESIFRLIGEKKKTVDIDTLSNVCDWIGMPLDMAFKNSKSRKIISSDGNSISNIIKIIKEDKTLSDQSKDGLIELMEVAYRRLVEIQ